MNEMTLIGLVLLTAGILLPYPLSLVFGISGWFCLFISLFENEGGPEER